MTMVTKLPEIFTFSRTREQHLQDHKDLHARYHGKVWADDYTTLQAAVNAVPDGGVLMVPAGRHSFERITISQPLTIRGMVARTANRSLFGSAGWGDAYDYRTSGSVLECTATDGIGIDARAAPLNLENVMVVGEGDDQRTTTGIATGATKTRVATLQWQNVIIANFATGLSAVETYESTFIGVEVYGCQTGLYLGSNASALRWYSLAFRGNHTDVHLHTAIMNEFYGGAMQGTMGTGFYLQDATENFISGYWFESEDATYSIDISGGNRNVISDCRGATAGCRMRINGPGNQITVGANWTAPIELLGNGNVVHDALHGSGVVIDPTSWWNRVNVSRDLGSLQTAVTDCLEWGGQRRGGLAFVGGDPVLQAPDGGYWRVKVDNGGALTTEKII